MIAAFLWLLAFPADIRVEGCLDKEEIQRLAQIEISTQPERSSRQSEDVRGQPSHSVHASVLCQGDFAALDVSGEQRLLSLEEVDPRARARLIALALVELIDSASTRLEPSDEPGPTPKKPAPAKESSASHSEAFGSGAPISDASPSRSSLLDAFSSTISIAWSVDLAASRLYFSTATGPTAWGGRGRVSVVFDRWLGARVDLGVHAGAQGESQGRVHLLFVDGALSTFTRLPWSTPEVDLGLGLRFGWADLEGEPATSTSIGGEVSGLWAGPFAFARLALSGGPINPFVESEIGIVTRPVKGVVDEGTSVDVDDAFLCVSAGVSF